jgi:hypothetical protein
MRASAKPQFSQRWWTSEKPDDLEGTDLEEALQATESALANQRRRSTEDTIDECLEALEELESAVDTTIRKECDKKQHKDVITVLKKFAALIKAEVKRLQDAQQELEEGGEDEEDEEESDDKIFQPDYLYKMLKLLKSTGKELNFGFGLDTKNPEASKLVLTRKGKPERLMKALKRTGAFSDRQITYGKAVPDPKDGKTLVFMLAGSAGEPPQVLKLGRRFLQSDKNLRFRKLRLELPGGRTFVDSEADA